LLLALGGLAPLAAAQEPAGPTVSGGRHGSWITATYGAGGGSPYGAYLSLGVAIGDVRYSGSLVGVGPGRGVLIQGDLGQDAGALSIGTPVPFLLKLPRAWEPFGAPLAGIVPKATLLRTWNEDDGRRTYLGVTAELTVLLHFRVGWLWRVAGPSGQEQIVTWGVGLGL
jgi:hypothetical protein